jgi:hypothetical protein
VRELFGIEDRADGLDEATGDLEWHDGAGAPLGVLEHHAGLRRGMRRLDAFSRLLG